MSFHQHFHPLTAKVDRNIIGIGALSPTTVVTYDEKLRMLGLHQLVPRPLGSGDAGCCGGDGLSFDSEKELPWRALGCFATSVEKAFVCQVDGGDNNERCYTIAMRTHAKTHDRGFSLAVAVTDLPDGGDQFDMGGRSPDMMVTNTQLRPRLLAVHNLTAGITAAIQGGCSRPDKAVAQNKGKKQQGTPTLPFVLESAAVSSDGDTVALLVRPEDTTGATPPRFLLVSPVAACSSGGCWQRLVLDCVPLKSPFLPVSLCAVGRSDSESHFVIATGAVSTVIASPQESRAPHTLAQAVASPWTHQPVGAVLMMESDSALGSRRLNALAVVQAKVAVSQVGGGRIGGLRLQLDATRSCPWSTSLDDVPQLIAHTQLDNGAVCYVVGALAPPLLTLMYYDGTDGGSTTVELPGSDNFVNAAAGAIRLLSLGVSYDESVRAWVSIVAVVDRPGDQCWLVSIPHHTATVSSLAMTSPKVAQLLSSAVDRVAQSTCSPRLSSSTVDRRALHRQLSTATTQLMLQEVGDSCAPFEGTVIPTRLAGRFPLIKSRKGKKRLPPCDLVLRGYCFRQLRCRGWSALMFSDGMCSMTATFKTQSLGLHPRLAHLQRCLSRKNVEGWIRQAVLRLGNDIRSFWMPADLAVADSPLVSTALWLRAVGKERRRGGFAGPATRAVQDLLLRSVRSWHALGNLGAVSTVITHLAFYLDGARSTRAIGIPALRDTLLAAISATRCHPGKRNPSQASPPVISDAAGDPLLGTQTGHAWALTQQCASLSTEARCFSQGLLWFATKQQHQLDVSIDAETVTTVTALRADMNPCASLVSLIFGDSRADELMEKASVAYPLAWYFKSMRRSGLYVRVAHQNELPFDKPFSLGSGLWMKTAVRHDVLAATVPLLKPVCELIPAQFDAVVRGGSVSLPHHCFPIAHTIGAILLATILSQPCQVSVYAFHRPVTRSPPFRHEPEEAIEANETSHVTMTTARLGGQAPGLKTAAFFEKFGLPHRSVVAHGLGDVHSVVIGSAIDLFALTHDAGRALLLSITATGSEFPRYPVLLCETLPPAATARLASVALSFERWWSTVACATGDRAVSFGEAESADVLWQRLETAVTVSTALKEMDANPGAEQDASTFGGDPLIVELYRGCIIGICGMAWQLANAPDGPVSAVLSALDGQGHGQSVVSRVVSVIALWIVARRVIKAVEQSQGIPSAAVTDELERAASTLKRGQRHFGNTVSRALNAYAGTVNMDSASPESRAPTTQSYPYHTLLSMICIRTITVGLFAYSRFCALVAYTANGGESNTSKSHVEFAGERVPIPRTIEEVCGMITDVYEAGRRPFFRESATIGVVLGAISAAIGHCRVGEGADGSPDVYQALLAALEVPRVPWCAEASCKRRGDSLRNTLETLAGCPQRGKRETKPKPQHVGDVFDGQRISACTIDNTRLDAKHLCSQLFPALQGSGMDFPNWVEKHWAADASSSFWKWTGVIGRAVDCPVYLQPSAEGASSEPTALANAAVVDFTRQCQISTSKRSTHAPPSLYNVLQRHIYTMEYTEGQSRRTDASRHPKKVTRRARRAGKRSEKELQPDLRPSDDTLRVCVEPASLAVTAQLTLTNENTEEQEQVSTAAHLPEHVCNIDGIQLLRLRTVEEAAANVRAALAPMIGDHSTSQAAGQRSPRSNRKNAQARGAPQQPHGGKLMAVSSAAPSVPSVPFDSKPTAMLVPTAGDSEGLRQRRDAEADDEGSILGASSDDEDVRLARHRQQKREQLTRRSPTRKQKQNVNSSSATAHLEGGDRGITAGDIAWWDVGESEDRQGKLRRDDERASGTTATTETDTDDDNVADPPPMHSKRHSTKKQASIRLRGRRHRGGMHITELSSTASSSSLYSTPQRNQLSAAAASRTRYSRLDKQRPTTGKKYPRVASDTQRQLRPHRLTSSSTYQRQQQPLAASQTTRMALEHPFSRPTAMTAPTRRQAAPMPTRAAGFGSTHGVSAPAPRLLRGRGTGSDQPFGRDQQAFQSIAQRGNPVGSATHQQHQHQSHHSHGGTLTAGSRPQLISLKKPNANEFIPEAVTTINNIGTHISAPHHYPQGQPSGPPPMPANEWKTADTAAEFDASTSNRLKSPARDATDQHREKLPDCITLVRDGYGNYSVAPASGAAHDASGATGLNTSVSYSAPAGVPTSYYSKTVQGEHEAKPQQRPKPVKFDMMEERVFHSHVQQLVTHAVAFSTNAADHNPLDAMLLRMPSPFSGSSSFPEAVAAASSSLPVPVPAPPPPPEVDFDKVFEHQKAAHEALMKEITKAHATCVKELTQQTLKAMKHGGQELPMSDASIGAAETSLALEASQQQQHDSSAANLGTSTTTEPPPKGLSALEQARLLRESLDHRSELLHLNQQLLKAQLEGAHRAAEAELGSMRQEGQKTLYQDQILKMEQVLREQKQQQQQHHQTQLQQLEQQVLHLQQQMQLDRQAQQHAQPPSPEAGGLFYQQTLQSAQNSQTTPPALQPMSSVQLQASMSQPLAQSLQNMGHSMGVQTSFAAAASQSNLAQSAIGPLPPPQPLGESQLHAPPVAPPPPHSASSFMTAPSFSAPMSTSVAEIKAQAVMADMAAMESKIASTLRVADELDLALYGSHQALQSMVNDASVSNLETSVAASLSNLGRRASQVGAVQAQVQSQSAHPVSGMPSPIRRKDGSHQADLSLLSSQSRQSSVSRSRQRQRAQSAVTTSAARRQPSALGSSGRFNASTSFRGGGSSLQRSRSDTHQRREQQQPPNNKQPDPLVSALEFFASKSTVSRTSTSALSPPATQQDASAVAAAAADIIALGTGPVVDASPLIPVAGPGTGGSGGQVQQPKPQQQRQGQSQQHQLSQQPLFRPAVITPQLPLAVPPSVAAVAPQTDLVTSPRKTVTIITPRSSSQQVPSSSQQRNTEQKKTQQSYSPSSAKRFGMYQRSSHVTRKQEQKQKLTSNRRTPGGAFAGVAAVSSEVPSQPQPRPRPSRLTEKGQRLKEQHSIQRIKALQEGLAKVSSASTTSAALNSSKVLSQAPPPTTTNTNANKSDITQNTSASTLLQNAPPLVAMRFQQLDEKFKQL